LQTTEINLNCNSQKEKKKSTLKLLVTFVYGFDLLHTEFAAVARLAEGQFFNDTLTKQQFLI
jgi:hypothetical protein